MTDFITVSSGAPSDITPGPHYLALVDISEPRLIYPQSGPNAGKEVALRDWTFATQEGAQITAGASTASGPRSKTYAWLTALLGTPPAVGASFSKDQLIGRWALGMITVDDQGWPRIANLSAIPPQSAPTAPPATPPVADPVAAPVAAAPAAPPVAQPTPAPAQPPVAAPAVAPTRSANDQLPF